MNKHEKYMDRCLELAAKGLGKVAPNPMVGCVIVHDGEIIGEGFHEKYGGPHAEVNAIESVKNKKLLKEATIYVNLEPCTHYGKTPPCADLLIQHKIPFVIVGNLDSNPLVAGKGIKKLIEAGADVQLGILENVCKRLNKRFFTFHEKKRPYIILKWAQSADCFIDGIRNKETNNQPIQISGTESKQLLHQWRSQEQAILVGTNTALLDNPQLTAREQEGINPLRITIDKWLRIPEDFHLLDNTTPTLIFTAKEKVSKENLQYLKIDFEKNIVQQILNELYQRDIQSLIVEGGEKLINNFIENKLWDAARVFISDKTLNNGVPAPKISLQPKIKEKVGNDQLFHYINE